MYLNRKTGRSHIDRGELCQDSARSLSSINRSFSIYVISDGAGSSKKSDIGSSLVCERILEATGKEYDIQKIRNKNFWIQVISEIQLELKKLIEGTELLLRDFASTIVAVVVFHNEGDFLCVHLGDGYIFGSKENQSQILSKQKNVEYANQTYLFTDKNFEENLLINLFEIQKYDYLFLTSDGLEPLMVKSGEPFLPFFTPLSKFLSSKNYSIEKKIQAIDDILDKASNNKSLGCYDDLSLIIIEL